jgi:hypothetical protein
VELVSPTNKDRPATRATFAGKCAAYLQRGVGVVVADLVTERQANLHRELMTLLGEEGPADFPEDCFLYAVAYRPVSRAGLGQLDLWAHPLALGAPLPTLPLFLRGSFVVPVDLEATYTEARQRLHLGAARHLDPSPTLSL